MKRTAKTKALVVSAIAAILGQTAVCLAGPTETSSKEVAAPPPPPPTSFFRANEFDIGAFATYAKGTANDLDLGIGEHGWGGGIDAAYFPWLYAGFRFQGAAISISRADQTAGIVTGDAVLRYPLDLVAPNLHLAPYAFGGVGGLLGGLDGFNHHGNLRTDSRVLGNVGGGLEYRVTPHIGLFGEAGYNFVDGPDNNILQVNWGARFAF
ncbi:MAG: outer membrane beta-barrel protein [Verrucomicrobia bacterium]|nr:outer membrane beta-barrel protein [Verrucomicrobiota bacterium]